MIPSRWITGFLILSFCATVFPETDSSDSCFCQLKGDLDDCSCSVENLDSFNNFKINPRLSVLLEKDYFRYFKVNMFKDCIFIKDASGKCGSSGCAVKECPEKKIPEGLKKNHSHSKNKVPTEKCDDNEDNELGVIDPHISDESKEAFETWKKYDDAQDNFCLLDDVESPDAVYYDLILNPERFTGYVGQSAVNVWKLIYEQNCFNQCFNNSYFALLTNLCLEKRVFYRMISGFHTSINVDVTANWLIPPKTPMDGPTWGPNLEEFRRRFDPDQTWGEGPKRLKNLYFTYLVELRALAKAAPYLEKEEYYTGNEKEDEEVRQIVKELLHEVKNFPHHFDETKLFQGDFQKLKEDFKVHFRNISRIMDCVGCDKCRLWGKLQITGMGTAMKILFSGDKGPHSTVTQEDKRAHNPFQLTRGEIVSLYNGFGRLSKSIHEVDHFRRMLS
ncbi:hypothetical protein CAPTEDRAFT_101821 [Capitella teleta]|uniref:Uncharacterized protein n=1 Tax=Capitella teleta TaxID=283909 RepID=R7UCP7_CAPTE|nr:hypothetical protein CAPTEDRAFT_101821 [Capitella teleta]|eukprot:ELU03769.1 hypothetical protein CAPTEDRAFT_101821 [Capitella teleta]